MKLLKIEDIQEFVKINSIPENDKSSYPTFFSMTISTYQETLDLLNHVEYCQNVLGKLIWNLSFEKTLENPSIKEWILEYYPFFNEKLFLYGLLHFEVDEVPDGYLFFCDKDFIERKPFESLIVFWECMWILYFNNYHIDKENRPKQDPNDYYYFEPDPNDLSHLDRICNYLKLS